MCPYLGTRCRKNYLTGPPYYDDPNRGIVSFVTFPVPIPDVSFYAPARYRTPCSYITVLRKQTTCAVTSTMKYRGRDRPPVMSLGDVTGHRRGICPSTTTRYATQTIHSHVMHAEGEGQIMDS